MTVTTDLQTATGIQRVLYLVVDGLEPYLFQRNQYGTPSWARSVKVCLNAPEEKSMGISLDTLKSDLSAMTFALDDIEDTDGVSYFGKLFAPGLWNLNPHVRMAPGDGYHTMVNADADSVPIKTNATLGQPSNGFIGAESINWTSTNSEALVGVIKGLWPAINTGGTWGKTYRRPQTGGTGYLYHVGTEPFSYVGRRVALYMATYDTSNGDWYAESQSHLLWAGRIADQIIQRGRTRVWDLSCTSVMQELDQNTPVDLAVDYLNGINLMGDKGRRFTIVEYDSAGDVAILDVSVTQGVYTPSNLVKELRAQTENAANWTEAPGKTRNANVIWTFSASTGKAEFYYGGNWSGRRVVVDPNPGGETNHAFGALGFSSRGKFGGDLKADSSGTFYEFKVQSDVVSDAYHPLHRDYNGDSLYTEQAGKFWPTQGDSDTGDYGCVKIDKAVFAPYWNITDSKGRYFAAYTARGTFKLTLTTDPLPVISADGYVAQQHGKEKVKVEQVYIPKYKDSKGNVRGPFEQLLYPMLSTGTAGYNHDKYDQCPLDLSLGIEHGLVDVASFLRADKDILGTQMGHRKAYIIDKPTAFSTLIQREAQLFGWAVVWVKGKLRCRPVLHAPEVDAWTIELDDSSRAGEVDMPDMSMSTGTIINQYALDIDYNPTTGKFRAPLVVTDVDSVISTVTKRVSIKHPGVYWESSKSALVGDLVQQLLLGRFIRYALPVVDLSLAMTYLDRVFVGDVIKLTSSFIQDPLGSGTRSISALATVLNIAWNYKTMKGSIRLLVHDKIFGTPWAPAAITNIAATNGGWDGSVNAFIINPYTWSNSDHTGDGNALAQFNGWSIVVHERATSDPTSPVTYGPFEVQGYEPSNHALTAGVAAVDLAGWQNTQEHVITFCDWVDAAVDQQNGSFGTWQADPDTELLGAANIAQRYK